MSLQPLVEQGHEAALPEFIRTGDDVMQIVDAVFGQSAPGDAPLSSRTSRLFDRVRAPESSQSLNKALNELGDRLKLNDAARTEIQAVLERTIRDNIGVVTKDIFDRDHTALITDTDYHERHYLGARIHYQPISDAAAQQLRPMFLGRLTSHIFPDLEQKAAPGATAEVAEQRR